MCVLWVIRTSWCLRVKCSGPNVTDTLETSECLDLFCCLKPILGVLFINSLCLHVPDGAIASVAAQKTSQTTTSSGSGGRGGLPLFDARSMERSLGSEGSPGTSMLAEGGEDLVGVPQASLEKHQQLFVRYSGLSEGGANDLLMLF